MNEAEKLAKSRAEQNERNERLQLQAASVSSAMAAANKAKETRENERKPTTSLPLTPLDQAYELLLDAETKGTLDLEETLVLKLIEQLANSDHDMLLTDQIVEDILDKFKKLLDTL